MTLLDWTKPKRIRSSQDHADLYQSDTGIPGTFMPNMSEADKCRWKAKFIGGDDPRVEIRKEVGPSLMLVVVRATHQGPTVQLSTNGKLPFSVKEWPELDRAVEEAYHRLTTEAT